MLLTHLSRWEAVYIYKCVCKWVQVDINTQLSLSTFLQGTGRYHGISTKMHLKVEKDTSHYCPSTLIAYAFPCLVREQRSLKNVQLSTSFLFSGMIYVKISSRSIDLFAVSYGSLKWVSINSQPTYRQLNIDLFLQWMTSDTHSVLLSVHVPGPGYPREHQGGRASHRLPPRLCAPAGPHKALEHWAASWPVCQGFPSTQDGQDKAHTQIHFLIPTSICLFNRKSDRSPSQKLSIMSKVTL